MQERIAELRALLGDEAKIYALIKDELLELKRSTPNDDRRTEIVAGEGELDSRT
jgi:DNA gyrase subunit A